MFTRGCQQHEFPLGYADYVQSNNWQGYQHVNTLVLNDEKMLRSLGGGQAVYLLINIQKTIENCHLYWICPFETVIFHSYVSLPEGKGTGIEPTPPKKKCLFSPELV